MDVPLTKQCIGPSQRPRAVLAWQGPLAGPRTSPTWEPEVNPISWGGAIKPQQNIKAAGISEIQDDQGAVRDKAAGGLVDWDYIPSVLRGSGRQNVLECLQTDKLG